jgi:hypothetical protein
MEIRERNPFFWRSKDADPADTIIKLQLGSDRINKATINEGSKRK